MSQFQLVNCNASTDVDLDCASTMDKRCWEHLFYMGFIILSLPCSGAQSNYYTVTLPNKAYANTDYIAAVTYHGSQAGGSSTPLDVVITLKGSTSPIQQASGSVSVGPGETKQIIIKIGDWLSGSYTATTTGSGAFTFTNTKYVTMVSKSVSTFIQTDKARYQPSQMVQLRVVLVDSNLIPYQKESLMVQIKDPQENIIKKWDNAKLDHGVFQGTLPLSEQPVMGTWTIMAQVGSNTLDKSKTTTAQFVVEEYVLPLFDVTIDTPYVTFEGNNDPSFTITVKAKYVFGGPVDGNLDLTLNMAYCPSSSSPSIIPLAAPLPIQKNIAFEDVFRSMFCYDDNWGSYDTCELIPVNIQLPIKGTATVTVKASELYRTKTVFNPNPNPCWWDQIYQLARRSLGVPDENDRPFEKRIVAKPEDDMLVRPMPSMPIMPPSSTGYRDTPVNIVAVVTETLTGIKLNETAAMTIYAKDKKLTTSQPSAFKPGMPFPITVKLTRQDNQPVVNSGGVVQLSLTFNPTSSVPSQMLTLSQDGVAVFTVVPPMDATTLQIFASYQSVSSSTFVSVAKSKSKKYISVSVKTAAPAVGQNMDLEVKTTFPMNSPLAYVIVGRGNVRLSGTLPASGQTEAKFFVSINSFMAPHARCVVYYIDLSNGDMIADSIDIDIAGTFRTLVSLATNATEMEPGDNVTLNIKTSPDSLVALNSVDMSVLLLGAGNDITQKKVFNELQGYDVGSPVFYDGFFNVGYWRRPNYAQSFEQIFTYAGLTLVTNGIYNEPLPPQPLYMPVASLTAGGGGGGGGGRLAMVAAPAAPMMAMMQMPNLAMASALAGPIAPPPMALMDMAPVPMVEPARTRTYFPETWIWETMNTTSDGSVQVTYTVPDTITTWVINAFAMNNVDGMGIMDSAKNIKVFREFFIVLDLPYSVVRNEIITLKVLVFNYQTQDSQVAVTLTNSANQFNFINQVDQSKMTITQQAPAKGATIFKFIIQPTYVGEINLNVNAKSPTAADALIKQLLVKAEGSTEYYNKAVMIDLREATSFTSQILISIPSEAIPRSEYIEFTAIGDFMAPVLNNIDELIRMPYGCGEQNMINFVPDVVIMLYLQSTSMLTSDIKTTLLSYLNEGYQRELTYKHTDGSYSAFGNSDARGSTWLTAFVLKSFKMARPFITIDDKVIAQAKDFLVKQQDSTGEFKEYGNVIHTSLQGGSAKGVALTAFCLIAFLEDKTPNDATTQSAIDKAVAYLEGFLDVIDSVYDLAIVTYALQLSPKSQNKEKAFDLLQKRKTTSGTGNLIYWQASVTKPSGTYSYYDAPTTYDVEATSYALLCYATRSPSADIISILRWMVSKRNSLGGYSNSQDTVIGIQALATVGGSFKGRPDSSMTIEIAYNGQNQTYTLNKDNTLVTQKTPLPKEVRTVDITAKGSGVGIAQVSWNYNVVIRDNQQSFQITTTPTYTVKPNYSLKVCAKYLGTGTTSMVLYDVNTLSGYKWVQDSLPAVDSVTGPKQVDLSNEDTLVTIYYDSIPAGVDICITLSAVSSGDVSNLQDAEISVYDYYNTFKKGESYYNLPK